jgi:hypothetical protein
MLSFFFEDERMVFAIGIALTCALLILITGKTRGGMSSHDRARISAAWREALKHMQNAHALNEKVRKVAKTAFANDTLSTKEKVDLKDSWGAVSAGLTSGNESHWRTAVIRADAVLDMALRARGFPGETMAQRMNRAARKYPAVENAFKAHRLRNDLVHNPMRGITEKETRWALQIFERALRALGM